MSKFKTNIMCGGCIAKVTPELNKVVGENNWTVDITNPHKILSVTNDQVSEQKILEAIRHAGFMATQVE